ARSATIETVTVDPAREERWNAVEVGGQHDGGKRAGRRDDVAAFRVHGLLGHVKAKPAQLAREPPPGFALTAGCGVDVYQAARERYRIHASSSVRVSVRESRYFTMTGVASDNCHSGPLPAVTARAPGTTTAPSGITSGRSADGLMISPLTRSYTGVEPVSTVP